jgi:hypothetical protein
MSQQAAAGQAAPAGGLGAKSGWYFKGWGDPPSKGFKSSISKIAKDTFNIGKNHFAAQFIQSRKNVVNYLQCTAVEEGYLVVEMVRMGKAQTIALPPPVNRSAADVEDQKSSKVQNKIRGHAEERLHNDMGSVFPGGTPQVGNRATNGIGSNGSNPSTT